MATTDRAVRVHQDNISFIHSPNGGGIFVDNDSGEWSQVYWKRREAEQAVWRMLSKGQLSLPGSEALKKQIKKVFLQQSRRKQSLVTMLARAIIGLSGATIALGTTILEDRGRSEIKRLKDFLFPEPDWKVVEGNIALFAFWDKKRRGYHLWFYRRGDRLGMAPPQVARDAAQAGKLLETVSDVLPITVDVRHALQRRLPELFEQQRFRQG